MSLAHSNLLIAVAGSDVFVCHVIVHGSTMSSSPERESREKLVDGKNDGHPPRRLLAHSMDFLATSLLPLRPLLPSIFPLIVCLLCIPILIFFSGAAGWFVWRNVPVGWSMDVYLHYG